MKKYVNFKKIHQGESIIVLGCGPSLFNLDKNYTGLTFGVNDVAKHIEPTYLLTVNGRNSFTDNRWPLIYNSKAKAIFTHLDHRKIDFLRRDNIVKIVLGTRYGTNFNTGLVDYSVDSPYMAILISAFMGFKQIGLLGVDFTDANHNLRKRYKEVSTQYSKLYNALLKEGIELVNLSPASILTIPKVDLKDFLSGSS